MRLSDFALLADENVHPQVVAELRSVGWDVADVRDVGLAGASDEAVLQASIRQQRVVLTHDKDFGALAIARLQPLVGIIFLRPGHIDPQFSIETLRLLLLQNPDVSPPFILVAKRTGNSVYLRIRNL